MKKIIFYICFLCLILIFFSFVSADVISVNSGGSETLVINSDKYIEGFLFWTNSIPYVMNVILNSSLGLNTTNENLSVYYSSYDLDNDFITNITDWRINGGSVAILNMPLDRKVSSTSIGVIRDYSTYGNNGTLIGANWVSNCKIGGCYDFDGVNDLITSFDDVDFEKNNFTVEMWAKKEGNSTGGSATAGTLFSKYYAASPHREYYLFYRNDDTLDFTVFNETSSFVSLKYSAISNDVWHYIVAVKTGSTLKLYVDNILVNSTTGEGIITLGHGAAEFMIGALNRSSFTPDYFFNGKIDEVKFYDFELSSEQINSNYQEGLLNHSIEKIVSQETEIGENWSVAITPNDAYEDGVTVLSNNLTILGIVPNNPTNVSLISLDGRNESDVDLNCSGYISDNNDLLLTVYVDWIKDGNSQFIQVFSNQQNASVFSTLLNNGNLTLGDVWKCSLKIYDGEYNSSWVDSNTLTIIDITSPNVTIISPNSTYNYTTLDIDFNISISENENVSWCGYSINGTSNITMTRFNDSYFWYQPLSLTVGTHNVTFYCNDTSGNWGTNFTNFTIFDEAAIAIQLSPALSLNVNWSLRTLPADDLPAEGNNGTNETEYWVNLSVTSTTADLYVKADGDLQTLDLDILGLGNETFSYNSTNASVPDLNRLVMDTSYVLIAENLPSSIIYLKFYLDAPSGQPAGIYLNSLDFKAVSHGNSP